MPPRPRSGRLYDDPGDLIAAIPGLLRFTPVDSVVLITYTGHKDLRLEAVLRMDLPAPEHVGAVAAQLRTVAVNHNAAVLELVVLGGGDAKPPDLPHRALAEELADVFDRAGIVLAHAVWAPGATGGGNRGGFQGPRCAPPGPPPPPPRVAAPPHPG